MAQYYVQLPTMIAVCGAPAFAGMPMLLRIIGGAAELADIRLRRWGAGRASGQTYAYGGGGLGGFRSNM